MEEDLKKKQDYLKLIYNYLENKDTLTPDEIHMFYIDDLQYTAPYDIKGNKEFKRMLLELDDLSEEFDYSELRKYWGKYDKKLISILKKYGYYKEPKKS